MTDMANPVTFTGVPSSDGQCFCWSGVSEQDAKRISDDVGWRTQLMFPEDLWRNVLYPAGILRHIGCESGKRYKFTISAEPVE